METRRRDKAGATIPWTQERAEHVCDQLEHADEAVREEAVADLEKVAEQRERLRLEVQHERGNDTVVERLCRSLGSPDPDTLSSSAGVRVTALWCMRYVAVGELSEGRRNRGIAACVARLSDSEFVVRQASVECLANLQAQSVVGQISSSVLSKSQWVAQEGALNALRVLAAPGDVEIMQVVSKKLTHANNWVRGAAVSVLHALCPQGGSCPHSVVKALAQAAMHRDERGWVDPSITEATREADRERRNRTRAHILHLLGRLLGTSAAPLVSTRAAQGLTVRLLGAVSLVPGDDDVKMPLVVRLGKSKMVLGGDAGDPLAVLDSQAGSLLEIESADGARGSVHVQDGEGERFLRMELVDESEAPRAALWLGMVLDSTELMEDTGHQGGLRATSGAPQTTGQAVSLGADQNAACGVPDELIEEVVQSARVCLDAASQVSVDVRYECVKIVGLASKRCSRETWEGCMRLMERVACMQGEAMPCRREAVKSLQLLIEAGVAGGCQLSIGKEEAAERMFLSMVGSREECMSPFHLAAWLRGSDAGFQTEEMIGGESYSLDAFREACLRHKWPSTQVVNDEAKLTSIETAIQVLVSCLTEPHLRTGALFAINEASSVVCRSPRLLENAFASLRSHACKPLIASQLCIDIVSIQLDTQSAGNMFTCYGSLMHEATSCTLSLQLLTQAGFKAQLAFDEAHHGSLSIKMWQGEDAGVHDGDLIAEALLEVSAPHTRGCVPTGCSFIGPQMYRSVELKLRGRKVGSAIFCVHHSLEHQDSRESKEDTLKELSTTDCIKAIAFCTLILLSTDAALCVRVCTEVGSETGQKPPESGADHSSGRTALLETIMVLCRLLGTQTYRVDVENLVFGGEIYIELLREHGLPLPGSQARIFSRRLQRCFRPAPFSEGLTRLEECMDPHSARQGMIALGSLVSQVSQVGGGDLGHGQDSVIVDAMLVCVQIIRSHPLSTGVVSAGMDCLRLLELALPKGGVAAQGLIRDKTEEPEAATPHSALQPRDSVILAVGEVLNLHCRLASLLFTSPKGQPLIDHEATALDIVLVPDDCSSLENALALCEYRASHHGSKDARSRIRVCGGSHNVGLLKIGGGVDIECDEGTILEGTIILCPGARGTLQGACFKATGGACAVVEGGEWVMKDCTFIAKDAFKASYQIPEEYDATESGQRQGFNYGNWIRSKAGLQLRQLDQDGTGMLDGQTINTWLSEMCGLSEQDIEGLWDGVWADKSDSGASAENFMDLLLEFMDLELERNLPAGDIIGAEEVKAILQKGAKDAEEARERSLLIALEQGDAVRASDGVGVFCCDGSVTLSGCTIGSGQDDETSSMNFQWGIVVSGCAIADVSDSVICGVQRSAMCLQGTGCLNIERTRFYSCSHALRYSPPACVCKKKPGLCVADGIPTLQLRDCVVEGQVQVWMDDRRPLVACHGRNIVGNDTAAGLDAVPAQEVLVAAETIHRHLGQGGTDSKVEVTGSHIFESLACDNAGYDARDRGAPEQARDVLRRKLKIFGIEVQGLRKNDSWITGGKADPYVVLEVAGKQRKTKWVSSVVSATWDNVGWDIELGKTDFSTESRDAKVSSSQNGPGYARMDIWDHDCLKNDDLVGTAILPLSLIEPQEEQSNDFDIQIDLLDANKVSEASWDQEAMGDFAARQWAGAYSDGSLSSFTDFDLEPAVVRVEASCEDDGCGAVQILEHNTDSSWQSYGKGEGAWISIQLCDTFLITSISFKTLSQVFIDTEDALPQDASQVKIGSVAIECGGVTHRLQCTDGGQCALTFGDAGVSCDCVKITVESVHSLARRNNKSFALVFKSLSIRGRSCRGRIRVWGRMEVERGQTLNGMVDTSALLTNLRPASLRVLCSALELMSILAMSPDNREQIARSSVRSALLLMKNFGKESTEISSNAFKAFAKLFQSQDGEPKIVTSEVSNLVPKAEKIVELVADTWKHLNAHDFSIKRTNVPKFAEISVLNVQGIETKKSNIFCIVSSMGSQVCTPQLAYPSESSWEYTTVLPLDSASKISFTLWCTDRLGDELVGEASLSLSNATVDGVPHKLQVWLDLNNPFKRGNPICGQLRVVFRPESTPLAIGARNTAGIGTEEPSNVAPNAAQIVSISQTTTSLLRLHSRRTTLENSDLLSHALEFLDALCKTSSLACDAVSGAGGLFGLLTLASRLSLISLPSTLQDNTHAEFETSLPWRGLLSLRVAAENETQPHIAKAFCDVRTNVCADKRVGRGEEDLGFAYSAWGMSFSASNRLANSKSHGFLDKEQLARYLSRLASPPKSVIHGIAKGGRRTRAALDSVDSAHAWHKSRPMSGRRGNFSPETLEVSIVDGVLIGNTQVNACVVVTIAGTKIRSPPIPHLSGHLAWTDPLVFRGSHLTGGELLVELVDDTSSSSVDSMIGYAQVPLVRPQMNKQDRLQGVSDWVQLQNLREDGRQQEIAKLRIRQRWTSWMEPQQENLSKDPQISCCVLQDVKMPRGWSLGDLWDASHKADWPMPWRVKEGRKVEVRLSKAPTIEFPTDRLQQDSASLFTMKWTRTRFALSERETGLGDDDRALLNLLDEMYKTSCGIEISENQLTAPMHMTSNTSRMYVVDGTVLKDGALLLIEREIVAVLQGGGTHTLTVARAQQKTKAALHQAGTAVVILTTEDAPGFDAERNIVYTRVVAGRHQQGDQKRHIDEPEWNSMMEAVRAVVDQASSIDNSAWTLLERFTASRQLTARHMMDVVHLHDMWAARQSMEERSKATDRVQASSRAWSMWRMERQLTRHVLSRLADLLRTARVMEGDNCRLWCRLLQCTVTDPALSVTLSEESGPRNGNFEYKENAHVAKGWVRASLHCGTRVRETKWVSVDTVNGHDGGYRAVLNAEFEVPVASRIDMIPQSAMIHVHVRCGHAIICTASASLPIGDILSCPQMGSFVDSPLNDFTEARQADTIGRPSKDYAVCGCGVLKRCGRGPVWLSMEDGTSWHPPMSSWHGSVGVELVYDGMGLQELKQIWDEIRCGVEHTEAEVRAASINLLLEATALTSPRSCASTLRVCRTLLTDKDWRVCSQAVRSVKTLLLHGASDSEGIVPACTGDLATALEVAASRCFPVPLLAEITDALGFCAQKGDMRASCTLARVIWWESFQEFIRQSERKTLVIRRQKLNSFWRIMSISSVAASAVFDRPPRVDTLVYFKISTGLFSVRSTLQALRHDTVTWHEDLAVCIGDEAHVSLEIWVVDKEGKGHLFRKGEFPVLVEDTKPEGEVQPVQVRLRDPGTEETVGTAAVECKVFVDDTPMIRREMERAGLKYKVSVDDNVEKVVIIKQEDSQVELAPAATDLLFHLLCALSKIACERDRCSLSAALVCYDIAPHPSVRSKVISMVARLIPAGCHASALPWEMSDAEGSPSWKEHWSRICCFSKGHKLGTAPVVDLWKG